MQTANEQLEAELRQKDEEIRQKNTQLNQIQVCSLRHFPDVTLITTTSPLADLQRHLRQREEELLHKNEELRQKDARLGEQVNRNQQLTTQLREKDNSLRQREEELLHKNADISRLQGDVQTLQVSTWYTARRSQEYIKRGRDYRMPYNIIHCTAC